MSKTRSNISRKILAQEQLLKHVANEEFSEAKKLIESKQVDLNHVYAGGDNLLHIACRLDNPRAVTFLLSQGMDPDCVDKDDCSPLAMAVARDHVPCVEALLAGKANASYMDILGLTPPYYAIFKGNVPILRMLIKHLKEKTQNPQIASQLLTKDGKTLLQMATTSQMKVAIIEYLTTEEKCDIPEPIDSSPDSLSSSAITAKNKKNQKRRERRRAKAEAEEKSNPDYSLFTILDRIQSFELHDLLVKAEEKDFQGSEELNAVETLVKNTRMLYQERNTVLDNPEQLAQFQEQFDAILNAYSPLGLYSLLYDYRLVEQLFPGLYRAYQKSGQDEQGMRKLQAWVLASLAAYSGAEDQSLYFKSILLAAVAFNTAPTEEGCIEFALASSTADLFNLHEDSGLIRMQLRELVKYFNPQVEVELPQPEEPVVVKPGVFVHESSGQLAQEASISGSYEWQRFFSKPTEGAGLSRDTGLKWDRTP